MTFFSKVVVICGLFVLYFSHNEGLLAFQTPYVWAKLICKTNANKPTEMWKNSFAPLLFAFYQFIGRIAMRLRAAVSSTQISDRNRHCKILTAIKENSLEGIISYFSENWSAVMIWSRKYQNEVSLTTQLLRIMTSILCLYVFKFRCIKSIKRVRISFYCCINQDQHGNCFCIIG